MTRWQRGEAEIDRLLAGGELQALKAEPPMVSSGCRKRAAPLARRQVPQVLTRIARSLSPMTRHVLLVPRCSRNRDCAPRHVVATMSSRWPFGASSAPRLIGMAGCGGSVTTLSTYCRALTSSARAAASPARISGHETGL